MDAPIRPSHDNPLRPHQPHGVDAHGHGRGDPFDTLAELFLGPPARSEATSPAPLRLVCKDDTQRETPSPTSLPHSASPASNPLDRPVHLAADRMPIEGIILGHLPVFASAWASQYAKHVAQTQEETVAFLRFTGDRASLDVHHAARRSESNGTRSDTLSDAIRAAVALNPRWIVRLPDACEPELADGCVDTLTLLTGADEAAIVACYRTLKSLTTREPDSSSDHLATGPIQWRVAIMGADPIKAAEAGKKIGRAAEAYLESDLEISACVARIGASRTSLLFDGPASMSWREAISLIRSSPTRFAPSEQSLPSPTSATNARSLDNARASIPVPETRPPSPREVASSESAPRPATPTTSPTDSIPLAGLRDVGVRCPLFPAVQLAVDDDGRLHIVERSGSRDPMGNLLAVANWARSHASLLALAAPSIENASEPTLHYVTSDPATDRRLLDTDVKVHAFVRLGSDAAILDLN
ncbi:MAG: hypothetical protein KF838_07695 [Phycisphaeraceae bacterium]|nr:MAG: hypothetical protein KF838_07695 [Phycisphaeraceae bacterium]